MENERNKIILKSVWDCYPFNTLQWKMYSSKLGSIIFRKFKGRRKPRKYAISKR